MKLQEHQGGAWTTCEGQGRGGGVEKTLKSHHPVSSIRIYGMLELLPSQAESRKFSSLLCKRLKLSSKHIYIFHETLRAISFKIIAIFYVCTDIDHGLVQ